MSNENTLSIETLAPLFNKPEAEQKTALFRFFDLLACTSDETAKEVLKANTKDELSELTKTYIKAGMAEATAKQRVSEMRRFRSVYVSMEFALTDDKGKLTNWTPAAHMGWHSALKECSRMLKERTLKAAAEKASKARREVLAAIMEANPDVEDAGTIRKLASRVLDAAECEKEYKEIKAHAKRIYMKYGADYATRLAHALKSYRDEEDQEQAAVVEAAPVVETEVATA